MSTPAEHTTWCDRTTHLERSAPCLSLPQSTAGISVVATGLPGGTRYIIDGHDIIALDRDGLTEARDALTALLDMTA